MGNRNPKIARNYHQATKHTTWSVQANRHYLDWSNQPLPFKVYLEGEKIKLPSDLLGTGEPALAAVAMLPQGRSESEPVLPDLNQIAYLLFYSAGVTKKIVFSQGEIAFRAAACAGALYPIEIYLVCGELLGLSAGVYHFNPEDFSLTRLRSGDLRGQIIQAAAGNPDLTHAPLTLIFSAITWRSSWKYQARSYRYHYWDCGMILANSLAACTALQLPASLLMGFVDDEVNKLVGIDGEKEKSLCLLPVGRAASPVPEDGDLPAIDIPYLPLSNEERAYPLIEDIHHNSRLENPSEVHEWISREDNPESESSSRADHANRLIPVERKSIELGKSLENVIVQRGSSRRFKLEPIYFWELSTMLVSATGGIPKDWPGTGHRFLNQIHLSVHAVDGLESGKYRYWPEESGFELLESGDFRSHAAHLCLGQELGGSASATVFFLADLDSILEQYGNRGYRVVQMEAGILGGKLYLGAYSLGRGATGLTFFDDEVIQFFSPAAAGLETIFVMAIGVPAPPRERDGRLIYLSPGTNR